MTSSARINEQGHLVNTPAPPNTEPVNADPMAWNTLHDMLDMMLEGDTEGALRASAKLTPHEIRRYAEATDELRTILTARIAVRYMEKLPEVKGLLREFMPHLLDGEQAEMLKGVGE